MNSIKRQQDPIMTFSTATVTDVTRVLPAFPTWDPEAALGLAERPGNDDDIEPGNDDDVADGNDDDIEDGNDDDIDDGNDDDIEDGNDDAPPLGGNDDDADELDDEDEE
jgi:hypothetical protein